MLYGARRAILALALWAGAAVTALLAVRSARTDPCGPHTGEGGFIVAVGVLTAAAVFGSLRTARVDRRGLVAALVSAAIGAAAAFGLYFALLFIWVDHCAN
jgi:hypothetical protein